MLKNKRGIVLITTMLTVVLVIMLLSSVVYSNLGSMRLASNFYGREEALMAAQSGVQYAITCLQSDITWRGDKKENVLSSSNKGLSVQERNGNVVGMLTTANGHKSFFRIKFNYEDGEQGFDGMNNSSDSDRIRSPYVSVNNLFNTTPTKVYVASPEGKLETKQYQDRYGKTRLGSKEGLSFPLGKSSCYLIVEGFAGNGVRDLTLDKVFSLSPDEAAKLMPRRVETYLALASDAQFTDSVACAAGDLDTDSKTIRISNAKGSTSPKMRSLHDLKITSKTVDFDNGQLFYGGTYTINGQTISEDSKYTVHQSTDSSGFTRLKWDDVTKANSKGQRYKELQAGTYVWSKDPKTGKNILKRYVGNFPPGTEIPAGTSCSKVSSLPGITIDADNLTMKVTSNLWVASDGKASSFIVRYEKEGNQATSRPIVAFLKNETTQTSPILSSNHDIYIEGATLGGGSITSKKDISLQGPSILESDPGIGVSIYAQGDVNLLPIESVTEQVKKAESDKLPGQGNNGDGNGEEWEFHDSNYKQHEGDLFNKFLDEINRWKGNTPWAEDAFSKGFSSYPAIKQVFDDVNNGYKIMIRNYINKYGKTPSHSEITLTYIIYKDEESKLGISSVEAAGLMQSIDKIQDNIKGYIFDENYWQQTENEDKDETNQQETEVDLSPEKVGDVQDYIDKDLASDNFRDTKEAQLSDLMLRYGKIKYSDQDISGVIYAWGNINADIGSNSTLNLTGAMVAYGGDPQKDPGENNKGKININAGTIGLTLDPDYMGVFLSANSKRKIKQVMFSSF